MTTKCPKCGGTMENGFTTAEGLIGGKKLRGQKSQLEFVVSGTPTARNPLEAFRQGTLQEPGDDSYQITGVRCSQCGFIEFYAIAASGQ